MRESPINSIWVKVEDNHGGQNFPSKEIIEDVLLEEKIGGRRNMLWRQFLGRGLWREPSWEFPACLWTIALLKAWASVRTEGRLFCTMVEV